MLNTLPRGYGAWHISLPTMRRVPHKDMPDYLTKTLHIDAGDIQMDLTGLYALDDGDLLAVEVNGELLSPANLKEVIRLMGLGDHTRGWSDALSADEHATLLADYRRSEMEDAE